jgi:two-component system, cell cycle response regulator
MNSAPTVRFEALAAAPERPSEPTALPRMPAPTPLRYGPLNILIAEDERASREGLAKVIRSLGHRCRTAKDGLEALQLHRQEHADVILSDWRMPNMDGLELCRQTRVTDEEGGYTYFILMTAFDDKEHFLKGMEAGADDYHGKPIDIDELQARLISAGRVLALYRQLAERNAMLRRDSQASFRLARVDPLTGVANRLRMNEDLETLWSRTKRYGHRYCIALADIDWFKNYNDRFGHLAGDAVLGRVAETIRKQLRQGDGLYRYGGEEFLVVLPEQSLGEAVQAMDRVRREVEGLAIPAGQDGKVVTVSIGVAELTTRDDSIATWLGRADRALYAAKRNGRNQVDVD